MSAVADIDVQAVLERLAAQEAEIAALKAAQAPAAPNPWANFTPPTFASKPIRPELLATTHIYALPSDLPQGMRDLRQLAAAVAISRGEPVPVGRDIPASYPALMRRIHTARKGGATWRDALVAAGLEVPSPERVAELAQALRDDLLERPLLDGLMPAVAAIKSRAMPHEKTDAISALENLMI